MPNEQAGRARRTFDEAFERDAVALLLKGGKQVKQLAEELGVSQWNVRDWREQYGPECARQDHRTTGRRAARAPAGEREPAHPAGHSKKTLGILVGPPLNATRG